MSKDNKNKKSTYKEILRRVLKYKAMLIFALIFAAISVIFTMYLPILFGDAIDCIIAAGKVDFALLWGILLKAAVTITLTGIFQWLMSLLYNKISYNVVKDIRKDAIAKIERLPLSFVDSHSSGDLISRIISDVDQFSDGLIMGFAQLFTGVLTIILTLVFMLMISPLITLVVVIITPLSLFVARFIAKKIYNMFQMQAKTRGEQTAFIDEMINNQKTVVAYTHEDENIDKFEEINSRLQKYSMKSTFFSSTINPTTRFINSLVYTGVGLAGAIAAISGSLSVGMLSSFLAYATQYAKPFNEISGVITELQNAFACAARVFELIYEDPESSDEGKIELDEVKGDVVLKDVCFSYTPDRPLIQNFNLNVKSGQHIAIVGPTGCGKTTLINLLMRFYDVNSGEITVDGVNIKDITRHSLRKNYGMVLQETWLKSGTIRDNIVVGKPEATDEEIITAAKAAHSWSFIQRLENGLDTVIGEDGGGLSQGQKQLLCITRIMLCLPPMLILDEATSSIDTRTEIRIQKAFAKLMKGKTTFIVAHRLSTIMDADLILVMKDGNIIEQGKHDELLKMNGFYTKLYNSSLSMS